MAIQIIRNEAGNCVTFQGSSNPVYWNACLSGEVDSSNSTLINIKNDIRTVSESETVYEFFNIPFANFEDSEGNSFSSAQDCADYITSECNVLGSIGQQVASDTDEFNFFLDSKDNTIIMSTGDYFPVNTIHAVLNSGTLNISSITGSKTYYTSINLNNVSINGSLITGTDTGKINTLNALFQNTGVSSGQAPSITSSLTVNLTEGETLNYELTADYGVGYEWDLSNVSGVTTVEGNIRKLVGGSSLATGTYNIPVKAINYNGEDSETVVLTVSTPTFANTKSIQFSNQDYAGANASLLDGVLGRIGNGSGSSDAWTISFWVKATNSSSGRVIFYYGSNDTTNGGYIEIRLTSTNKIRLQYGSDNNHIKTLAPNALTVNTWQQITMTYDGGTTGASSGDINNYYSRFKIYIDGVNQTTNNTNSNYGWSGAISGQNLRIAKLVSGNTLNGEKIDELAIWSSDQSSNISDIYNGGVPFDFSTLVNEPKHWWRMGDGDTYPNLQDNGTEANCVFVMYNMTSANIVNDVP
jgi:hypothetical protein